jgi:putative phosphoesterase
MLLGFISDVHGNVKALKKCLRVLKSFQLEAIYFLGDAVGYLPAVNEVLEVLCVNELICQKGNHEGLLIGELPLSKNRDRIYGLSRARKRIEKEYLETIFKWPERRVISLDRRNILLVHGSPLDYLQGYVYPNDDLSFMTAQKYNAIFLGHTHYPFVNYLQDKLIVNVGSCGLPRDQGNLASFALYDSAQNEAWIYRVRFDGQNVLDDFEPGTVSQQVIDCFGRSTGKPFGTLVEEEQ